MRKSFVAVLVLSGLLASCGGEEVPPAATPTTPTVATTPTTPTTPTPTDTTDTTADDAPPPIPLTSGGEADKAAIAAADPLALAVVKKYLAAQDGKYTLSSLTTRGDIGAATADGPGGTYLSIDLARKRGTTIWRVTRAETG